MGMRIAQAAKKPVPEGKHAVHVLNQHGDTTVTYDPMSPTEVAEARELFNRAMAGGGMVAYAMPEAGEDEVVKDFDVAREAERVIIAPAVRGG
jgi:hypothetical protein